MILGFIIQTGINTLLGLLFGQFLICNQQFPAIMFGVFLLVTLALSTSTAFYFLQKNKALFRRTFAGLLLGSLVSFFLIATVVACLY